MLRRQLLGGLGAAAAMALMQPARAQSRAERDVLVVIFLRGGADGLNLVVPYDDGEYYDLRSPGSGISVGIPADELIDLDGYFGLHSGLAPLLDNNSSIETSNLACVFGVGDPAGNRSHFNNSDRLELANGTDSGESGWLGRYLQLIDPALSAPLVRAVAINPTTPRSLAGAPAVLTLPDISGFSLGGDSGYLDALRDIYNGSSGDLKNEAGLTLDLLDKLEDYGIEADRHNMRPLYPGSGLGSALYSAGRVVEHVPDVEVIAIDRGGWDMHADERNRMAGLVEELGTSLAAFYADLEKTGKNATVVVMSEFGRRMAANGSNGTDHGFGSLMLLLGQNVQGGIYAQTTAGELWQSGDSGFINRMINPHGDMAVTTDYRAILGQILARRMGFAGGDFSALFPGFGEPGLPWDLVA